MSGRQNGLKMALFLFFVLLKQGMEADLPDKVKGY